MIGNSKAIRAGAMDLDFDRVNEEDHIRGGDESRVG